MFSNSSEMLPSNCRRNVCDAYVAGECDDSICILKFSIQQLFYYKCAKKKATHRFKHTLSVQQQSSSTHVARITRVLKREEAMLTDDKYIVINRYIYKLHNSMFLTHCSESCASCLVLGVCEHQPGICLFTFLFVHFVLALQNLIHVIAD